jgi:diguanylate cyclase (GGDEF)-like protein
METLKKHFLAMKAIFGPKPFKNVLSVRFRNINIILFALAFGLMAAVMSLVLNSAVNEISIEYAKRYSASSAETLSAHVVKEIGMLAMMARSTTIIDWLLDENNEAKKTQAYDEMAGVVSDLHSFNLYIGIDSSLKEYRVEKGHTAHEFHPFATLSIDNPDDAWYFDCINSKNDYLISVGIDQVLQRKRVWLDYKVSHNGVPIGVVCTGFEFSHIMGELFSQYAYESMRGLAIDEKGMILMDSSKLSVSDLLYHEADIYIENEFSDPAFLAEINTHLEGIGGYFEEIGEQAIIKLPSGAYRYLAIAPVRYTDWSVVVISGTPSLFDWPLFVPAAMAAIFIFVAFALVASAANYGLIFMPLGKMARSLAVFKENSEIQIYGLERDDELGHLSRTIQDLFTKANIDALTGIYNRRFMENSLDHIMGMLSRANGLLSVLLLDVDFFKKYNDTYGHDQGDICLKKVAQALASSMARAGDFTARYGGEEFVAVLPNTDEAGARVVAEKLLNNIRSLDVPHAGNAAAPYVTASVGVTTGKVTYLSKWDEFVKRADEALYMSKKNGRNQHTYLPIQVIND